jgi:Arylsulfotransferase (ASST)
MFLMPLCVRAQITPREGRQLNYRLIGFSFPAKEGARNYTIEIATGNHTSEESFSRNIIKKTLSRQNKLILEVPFFGMDYTWRVIYPGSRAGSQLYHFTTLTLPEVDSNKYRLRITEPAKEYKGSYVFIDASRTLYDMNGAPVWFLPHIEGSEREPRDLKLSPAGTITFLIDNKAYEVNYDGNILWRAPNTGEVSGDSSELYHHEFTRLKNGHYMILGSESAFLKMPSLKGSSMRFISVDKLYKESKTNTYQRTSLGTVIEYDDHGNVVWSWKSSSYFSGKPVENFNNMEGRKNPCTDVHENAFYFDEKTNYLYVNFKNINRILKVKYPDGKVVNEYGAKFKGGNEATKKDLFCAQHCCGISENGNLFTFNNNDCNPQAAPKILMMKEQPGRPNALKKVWEYEFPLEPMPPTAIKFKTTAGGHVVELPDRSIFAILSDRESIVFIVNPNKEILWSASAEQWDPAAKTWTVVYHSYRASIIYNQKNVEQMIWGH